MVKTHLLPVARCKDGCLHFQTVTSTAWHGRSTCPQGSAGRTLLCARAIQLHQGVKDAKQWGLGTRSDRDETAHTSWSSVLVKRSLSMISPVVWSTVRVVPIDLSPVVPVRRNSVHTSIRVRGGTDDDRKVLADRICAPDLCSLNCC